MASIPLIWTVPVVAGAAAMIILLTRSRRLEELATGLAEDARRLRELQPRLAALRAELEQSGTRVERIWRHWEAPPAGGSDGTAGPNGAGPPRV